MCSGRVDLAFIIRAFKNGVDGVFIGGCRLNECNYITHGNYHARNLVLLGKKILQHIGLNPDRLRIEFMSAGEGQLFTEGVDDFVTTVKELGPLGEAEGLDDDELAATLDKVTHLIPSIKIIKREKLAARFENQADAETYFSSQEVAQLVEQQVAYAIDPQKCQACMICLRKCPVDAISGGKKKIHVIDQDLCIKCGSCLEACPPRFGAVEKITGSPVPAPLAEKDRILVQKPNTVDAT